MTPEAHAARVWLVRERTELEAAALFATLSADLAASGAPDVLVSLARRCSDDERTHATLCRAIVDDLDPGLAALPPFPFGLGAQSATAERRALYASVALGCVTESLSTALLIEIRKHAEVVTVRDAVAVILEDEVRHARLGWAHLAQAAAESDVRWLAPAIPGMLDAALELERATDAPAVDGIPDLVRFGILERACVARICRETIAETIVPGLARYGIDVRRG